MFPFLFRKKEIQDPDKIVFEKWHTSFGRLKATRFAAEEADHYTVCLGPKKLEIYLKKSDVFAWVPCPYYSYDDFYAEAQLAIDPQNGHSAVGLILRYIDDANFYYFLISGKKHFRLDLVRNNHPLTLIDWTPSPLIKPDVNTIGVIARMDNLSFYINEEWAAEVTDDAVQSGKLGFAAQNYSEKASARFSINYLKLNSRPLELEKAYYRWTKYIPIDPRSRIELAQTFFRLGYYEAAAVQLKKAKRTSKLDFHAAFLLSESLIQIKEYQSALESIEECLVWEKDHKEAVLEKLNLLYLLNRLKQARTYSKKINKLLTGSPYFYNLCGNIMHALGEYNESEEFYTKAVELDQAMPLYKLNRAKVLEILGREREALELYLVCAGEFFRQEAYEDLLVIIKRILRLDAQNQTARSFLAKIFFDEKQFNQAEETLSALLAEGFQDSTVYFLYGCLLYDRDKREEALDYFKRAAEMEPDFAVYQFRYAECLFILKHNAEEAVRKAYHLASQDPWVLNLYGLLISTTHGPQTALSYFAQAYALLPHETDIVINYTNNLAAAGQGSAAIDILTNWLEKDGEQVDSAKVYNHLGNLYSNCRSLTEALSCYETALKQNPDNADFLKNCATVCLEQDLIFKAEEFLTRLLDLKPEAEVYNMIAHLAVIKAEYRRAELSLNKAIEFDPDNLEYSLNLASLFIDRRDAESSLRVLDTVGKRLSGVHHENYERLRQKWRTNFEYEIVCADCGRQWWVPKNLGIQPAFKLHGEPPPDCPGGKCPQCQAVYCVECAARHIRESRFVCPSCDEFLKISDDELKYLVILYNEINV